VAAFQAKLGDVAEGADPPDAREARAAVPTFAAWMDECMVRSHSPGCEDPQLFQALKLHSSTIR